MFVLNAAFVFTLLYFSLISSLPWHYRLNDSKGSRFVKNSPTDNPYRFFERRRSQYSVTVLLHARDWLFLTVRVGEHNFSYYYYYSTTTVTQPAHFPQLLYATETSFLFVPVLQVSVSV